MPIGVWVCSLFSAICFAGTLLLMALVDMGSVLARMAMPSLAGVVGGLALVGDLGLAWPLLLAGLLALPALAWVHVAASAKTDAFRSPLAVYPGAAAVVLVILTTVAVMMVRDGAKGVAMTLTVILQVADSYVAVVPAMVALTGSLLTGGRVPGAAAILSAPLVLLTLLSVALDQSMLHAAGGATIPFLLLALAMGPALVIRGGVSWRLIWPLGVVAILPFAIFLATGLFTPRELLSFALLVALVVGLAVHGIGHSDPARRLAITIAMENGALMLALAGYATSMIALASLGLTGKAAAADLGGDNAGLVLAALALAVAALSSVLTPVVALIPAVPFAGALISAGQTPVLVLVVLTLAAVLGLVARMTVWRTTGLPAGDDIRPPRTAGAVILLAGIALIALMMWAPLALLVLATLTG